MRRYGSFYNRAPAKYSTKPRVAKVAKEPVEYESIDVFAAAVAAQRINDGKYLKSEDIDTEQSNAMRDALKNAIVNQDIEQVNEYLTKIVETKKYLPNKVIMKNILNGDRNEITDEDRNEGQLIQDYWRMKIFDSLSGRYLSSFMQSSITIANNDKIKSDDYQAFGLIASMPYSYSRYKKKDEIQEIKEDAQRTSVHVGKIGENFTGEVKVLDCIFSNKWGCFYINAIQGSNLFMWSYNKEISAESVINITGRIKAHRDNNVTHLNYVKVKS